MSVTRFVIDRDTWIRGRSATDSDGVGLSRLLTHDGRRCCLGFYLEACGVADEALVGESEPNDVARHAVESNASLVPDWLLDDILNDSADACALMTHNDNERLSEEVREWRVTETFGRHGVTVEFTGSGLGFPLLSGPDPTEDVR